MNRRDILSAFAAAVAIPAETASPVTLKEHLQALEAAMRADPELAWAWHCNIAMPVKDATGVSHAQANEAGARLMQHLFNIDITTHPNY